MLMLERFTTDYDPVEDRIRLAGIGAGGAPVTLWLNQRMLRLLLPQLSRWAASRISPAAGGALPDVQEFHQAAALASRTGQDGPVVPQGPEALVVSVDYTDLGGTLRLTFKDRQAAGLATIDFPEVALRQWLAIMHAMHCVAGWPVDDFPDWIGPVAPVQLN